MEIRTGVAVKEVMVGRDQTWSGGVLTGETPAAQGVVTEAGECIYAKVVVSNLNPKLLVRAHGRR